MSEDWCKGFCRTCGTGCGEYCQQIFESHTQLRDAVELLKTYRKELTIIERINHLPLCTRWCEENGVEFNQEEHCDCHCRHALEALSSPVPESLKELLKGSA